MDKGGRNSLSGKILKSMLSSGHFPLIDDAFPTVCRPGMMTRSRSRSRSRSVRIQSPPMNSPTSIAKCLRDFPQIRPSVAVILTRPDHALIQKVYCPQQPRSLTLEVGFRAATVKPVVRCKVICLLGVPDSWPWPEFAHFRGQREQNLVKLPKAVMQSALSSVQHFAH